MSSRKRKVRQNASDLAMGGAMDTSMFWFGDMNLWGSMPTVPSSYLKPRAIIFSTSRLWSERLAFVSKILELRAAIYGFGFKVIGKTKKDRASVEKWWDENQEDACRIHRDVWQEFNLQRNAIVVWMKGESPIIYMPEKCTYSDEFGIERLSFASGVTPADVDRMGLAPDVKRQLKEKEIVIQRRGNAQDNKSFFFRVVKRQRLGGGLAWPELRSIFNTIQSWEAMEVADWQLADAMRTVYEVHQVGHDIKSGPHAGSPAHFLKKKRAEAIGKLIKNKTKTVARVLQMIVNFDHNIVWPRPDPKNFKADRYESSLQNLLFWSAPLGQMLLAKSVNPFLMPMLKAQAYHLRDYIRPFIHNVLRDSMKMPEGAQIVYSDDCLLDSRLLLDVIKTALTAGPLSQETFLEKTGIANTIIERERKSDEAGLDESETFPLYDPAHGAPEKKAGNPGGPNRTGKSKTA